MATPKAMLTATHPQRRYLPPSAKATLRRALGLGGPQRSVLTTDSPPHRTTYRERDPRRNPRRGDVWHQRQPGYLRSVLWVTPARVGYRDESGARCVARRRDWWRWTAAMLLWGEVVPA